MIAQFGDVKDVADGGTQPQYQIFDRLAGEHFVQPRSLDVEYLSAQRQYRLDAAIPALLCRAACRVSLYDKQLRLRGLFALAVRKLARQAKTLHRTLAQNRVFGGLGGLAGFERQHRFADDRPRVIGLLLQKHRKGLAKDSVYRSARLNGAELGFGLALELDFAQFDRNNRRQALEHVLTGKVLLALTQRVALARVGVERARERAFKSGHMRAPFGGVNIVGKREHARGQVVDILERYLHHDAVLLLFHIKDIFVDRLVGAVGKSNERAQSPLKIKALRRVVVQAAPDKKLIAGLGRFVACLAGRQAASSGIDYGNAQAFDQVRLRITVVDA